MENQEKIYQFWLHNLPGVGEQKIGRLLKVFGSERAVYEADEAQLGKILDEDMARAIKLFSLKWDLQKEYEGLKKKRIEFITCKDKEYPSSLRKIKKPPYAIYCIGSLPYEKAPAVAVIGARECSEYGRRVAEAFGCRLAGRGISVISGMARGIDGIAQQAAIDGGGKTFAVLGCGVDICYPASNRPLYEKIIDTGGGILSVFPPGSEPRKQNFPERNRIVAGLSDVLLVVEARQKSGTWITVDMALEQGKNVYAVPGRLTDRLSDGCNLLIRQGAGIALSPEDLIQELFVLINRKEIELEGSEQERNDPGKEQNSPYREQSSSCQEKDYTGERIAGREESVLKYLDYTPRSADELLADMRRDGHQAELPWLLSELIDLCMEGKARQVAGSYARTCTKRSDVI